MRAAGIVSLVLILGSLLGIANSPVARALARDQRVSILVFGVDAADLSRHTDTLMLAVYDPTENYLGILNIPRDTRIDLPGYRFRRVNEIYGYHLRRSNDAKMAAEQVRVGVGYLLSSSTVTAKVPYHVQVDFSGFRKMIDLLGGVWVDVKTPMHYDDQAGNLHIHFEPGRQLVQGKHALEYVRFRGSTGDRGRIYRQQDFLRNMVRRLANPMMIFRVPQMIAVALTSIDTNLSFADMLAICAASRRLRPENVGFYLLPGKVSGPYWAPNRPMAAQMATMLFAGSHPTDEEDLEIAPQSTVITINVWNASGQSGLGYKAARFLRRAGFDVVDWGNYPAEQAQTRVIDRRGRIGNARTVALAMGVDDFHSEPNPKVYVDVEVVLGQNFAGFDDKGR